MLCTALNQGHQPLPGWLAAALLAGLVLAGCNRPRPEAAPQKAEEPSPAPVAQPLPDLVPAEPETAAPASRPPLPTLSADIELPPQLQPVPAPQLPDLQQQLRQLKAKARREVVEQRRLIARIEPFKTELASLAQQGEQSRLQKLIPIGPQVDELSAALRKLAAQQGLEVALLELREEELRRRELPGRIPGDKPFQFEDNDIRGVIAGALVVRTIDREAVGRLLAELSRIDRLLLMRQVRVEQEQTLLAFEAWYFIEQNWPQPVAVARSLENEMQLAGIDATVEEVVAVDRTGHLQAAALSHKEYNESLKQYEEALRLQMEVRLKAAQADFFRRKNEQIRLTGAPVY